MSKSHRVRQGECLSSIAERYGLLPSTIWKAGENTKLKEERDSPDVLYPGDVLSIPEKRSRTESGGAGAKHRFKRKGVPAVFRLRLAREGKPRSGLAYALYVDGCLFEGKTDASGRLEHRISPGAGKGILRLGQGDEHEEYHFLLGHLDPVTETSGIQARLNNCGFNSGKVDGLIGPKTKAAIKAFQKEHGLAVDGIAGPMTQAKLKEVHGC